MTITDRVLHVLRVSRTYKFLTQRQIRSLCVPTDKDGSVTREILRKMCDAGYLQRRQAEVVNPLSSSNAPVYLPTEAGCCILATKTGDMSLLLDAAPGSAAWQNFAHYVEVSELFIAFDRALAGQDRVRLLARHFEHDIINPRETEPSKKYRTYTVVRVEKRGTEDHKIICVPDAATEIAVGPHRRAYFWELERGSDTPRRVAAKKAIGYTGLADTKKFQRIFPHAPDFAVIAVCPNAGWRDALREEVARKAGASLWRFAAIDDLKEDFLHKPAIYTCGEGPLPFVRPEGPPPATPSGEVREEQRT